MEDIERFQSTCVCLLNFPVERKFRTVFVILVHYIFMEHSRIASKLHFHSKCKKIQFENNLTVNLCVPWIMSSVRFRKLVCY